MTLRRVLLLSIVAIPVALAVAAWWALYTTSGARFAWARVQAALGDRVAIEYVDGSLASGLELGGFRYISPVVTVEVGALRAKVGVGLMPLAIHVDQAFAEDVAVEIRPNPAPGPAKSLEERLGRLILPFELHVDALDVQGLAVRAGKATRRIEQLVLAGSWTETIRIDRLSLAAGERRLQLEGSLGLHGAGPVDATVTLVAGPGLLPRVEAIDASAELGGDLRRYRYEIAGVVSVAGAGDFRVRGQGDGDFGAIAIAEAQATGETGTASARGTLGWAGGFHTDLAVELERLAVARLQAQWPEIHPVHGAFELRFRSPKLDIGEARLAIAGTDAELSGELSVHLDDERIDANIDWRDLGWPLGDGEARLRSDEGRVKIAGSFDDWTAEGSVALASAGLPEGRFSAAVRGDRDHAAGRITEGKVLGGLVRGTASASWRAAQPFAVDVALSGIGTGDLWPDWPGHISGRVVASGQVSPLRFTARLDDVDGRLRGWPLQADGGVALQSDGLSADGLVITHGESELKLDGGSQQPGGVRFTARIGDLGTYLEGVSGGIEASGELVSRNGEPALDLTLRSGELSIGERGLADAILRLEATRQYQVLDFQGIVGEQRLALAAEGVPDDPASPEAWEGTLTAFSLVEHDAEVPREIRLVQSASLRLAPDAVSLQRACLQGSIEARLCVQFDWVKASRVAVVAELDSIAVDRVNQFVDTGFSFDQQVTGEMRWEKRANDPPTASAELEISPGTIRNVNQDDAVVRTGTGIVLFEIQDGALLEGSLVLPLPGTGTVEGEFSIADLAELDGSAIDGRLHVIVDDIAAIRILVPALSRADGRLAANVDIGGTVAAPILTGEVRLREGTVLYQPLGLLLEHIDLRATFDEGRAFGLAGQFMAGEGHGRLTSSGAYGDGFRNDLLIALVGEQLRLIDLPDLQATANANLNVGFDEGVISLDGSVLIPHARISPRSLPATRYSESDDVVIVAGELPAEREEERRSPLKLDGVLTVGLGDDVVVDIDLAEAKVTGSTTFSWNENLLPVADGRYEISGDVRAYGQVLDITEGTVRFPNIPADNPYLRIRAEREIFGNSQVKTAGILIDGRLKEPTVEPYTDPRTSRERALTLLVTGSDFDLEQGVGAIGFGTYIAPRLFVSYGIGLFDQENVISARYDLGKGIGLKATSGQSESGVDIIYHVER